MISIDGSYLEGGGQIVRTALSFSALTQQSFEVADIRKGRKDPGLKSQHLHGIKALRKISGAVAIGDELGSTSLKFYPKKLLARNIEIDIRTAGSITLLLQSLLLPALFVKKGIRISIIGGTDVSWSPSFDYFSNALLPQVQKFAKVEAKLIRRGYHPKGNGQVEISISPKFKIDDFSSFGEFISNLRTNIPKFDLKEQHSFIQIKGISHASMNLQSARVAERQSHSAQEKLARRFKVPIKISSEYQDTLSTGSGITLWAIFSKKTDDIDEFNPIRIGSDVLGEQGKKSEIVGEECANKLIEEIESKAPVDSHLADQILPYLALAGGKIKTSKITNHTKSNIYAIEQFMGRIFEVDERENTISVD